MVPNSSGSGRRILTSVIVPTTHFDVDWLNVGSAVRHTRKIVTNLNIAVPLACSGRALILLIDSNHLLAYAIRANSRRGEGIVRVRRKQPFAGFALVFLLRQDLHGSENYGLVQTAIPMVVVRNQRCGLTFIRKCHHYNLPMAIATGASQPGQNCVFDPCKRTSKTPQPSQNLSSRELTTSEEWRDSPQRSMKFQFDPWLIGSPRCFGIRRSSRSFLLDHRRKRIMQPARQPEIVERK